MVDEENSLDDINLDDFNFDELLKDDNSNKDGAENDALLESNDLPDADILKEADFDLGDVLTEAGVNDDEKTEDVSNGSISDAIGDEENVAAENKTAREDFDIFENQDIKEQVQDMPETVEQTLSSDVEDEAINEEEDTVSNSGNDVETVSESYENVVDEEAIKKEREQFFEEEVLDNTNIPEVADNVASAEENSIANEDIEAERQEFFAQNNNVTEENNDKDLVSLVLEEEKNQQESSAESKKIGFLKWYSGELKDKCFEIDKNFESSTFEADEECKTLHINVGYDTYGWQVQFADGMLMNLQDVREYQIRNGRLPSFDGRVVYGQRTLVFSGVERIVVYESVKYFSYGV